MARLNGPARELALHAAAVVLAYTALFAWLFGGAVFGSSYAAQSDLYEYFLPLSLAPLGLWSRFEFAGIPTVADAADNSLYPVHLLLARGLHAWDLVPVSAYVLAASFCYAYVLHVTRSKLAAAAAGLIYSLSEPMVGRLPHLGMLHVQAWLPFTVLAIDRSRECRGWRWIGLGSLGFGCFFLAGHAQPVVYAMYVLAAYCAVGALRSGAGVRPWLRAGVMVGLGLALAAVKAIPVAEATRHLARQSVSPDQFTSHAVSWSQLAALVIPAVPHDILETPLYCGIAALVLASCAWARPERSWRVWFWTAVCVAALTIALGNETPAANALYHLPLYDKFRIASRHLFLMAFGVAVLAGAGIAAVSQGRLSRGGIIVRAATLLAAVAVVAWISQGAAIPRMVRAAAAQSALLAAATAALLVLRARPVLAAMSICAVVPLDLLLASQYPIRWSGADVPTVPAQAAISPSIHARRLAANAAPAGQRLLALDGTQVDPVAPGAFARAWRIPIAGGYGPMLLENHRALAGMGTNGTTELAMLSADNTALDLLAVRYVLVQPGRHLPRGKGTTAAPLEWTIGRGDCGYPFRRRSHLALPPAGGTARIELVAYMRCGEHVPEGTHVATLRAIGADGQERLTALHAGAEIAELSLADPAVRQRAKHGPAERAAGGQGYVVRWRLEQPLQATRLEVEAEGFGGWITIDRVVLFDAGGEAHAVEAPAAFLADATRWRETGRFRTSRTSDRVRDEDAGGETEVVVFENARARPRAWIVEELIVGSAEDMLAAAHTGYVSDGRRFDPAAMAIVDAGAGPPRRFPPGTSQATVSDTADGRVVVDVTSEGGGFLVLSESSYPGWTARVDGTAAPVHRANASLQGVVVPAGRHVVEFVFAPATATVGGGISIAALLAALALTRRV